jgi:hypothetical protein
MMVRLAVSERKPSVQRNEEMEQEVLRRLSEGEPLAVICRSDPERFPTPMSWGNWVSADEGLAIAYARAREVGFDAIAADCLNIADDKSNDTRMAGGDENEREVANTEWISRSKLRVETRLKLLAKWDPKRYGEKTLVGSDPENPLPAGFQVNLVKREAD